jgi:mycoredoxin
MRTAPGSEVFYHPSALSRPDGSAPELGVDVTVEPGAAARLAALGVEVPADLPAVLLHGANGRLRLLGMRLSAEETAALVEERGWRPTEVTVFASAWCSDCRRLKRLLGEAGLAYGEVDIGHDPVAEAALLQRSGGRRVVPTLVLDRRIWAFNPEPPLFRRLVAS